jgi:hypothetical protein
VRVSAPEYSIEKQVQIVYVITSLHNFIITDGLEATGDTLTIEDIVNLSLATNRAEKVVGNRYPNDIRYTTVVVL